MGTSIATMIIDELGNEIVKIRKKPLLVLFYPARFGRMTQYDIEEVYDEFRNRKWKESSDKKDIDVLIHTYGGDANVGYLLGQIIHNFVDKITFLVPNYAFSGGTLLCLSGVGIELGSFAQMSPLDLIIQQNKKNLQKTTELVSIDYFMNFAKECRKKMEIMFNEESINAHTTVDSDLLVELVKEVGGIQLGAYYRLRKFTEEYAKRLLHDYMFKNTYNKDELINKIIQKFLFEYPTHSFVMDYHLLKDLGLPVVHMDENIFDKTRGLVHKLQELSNDDIVCKKINEGYKMPFFRLYDQEYESESTKQTK